MKKNTSETRNLILFFVITYAFTWLFWIPAALANRDIIELPAYAEFLLGPSNPAAWGPFIAAFTLTILYEGMDGAIKLGKRAFDFGFDKIWWVPIISLFLAINGVALMIAKIAGESIPELFWLTNPLMIGIYFVQYLLTGGPLQEEFGWRGYALDRLQTRFNALHSSVILGLMWGIWHLPYFWVGEEIIYQHMVFGLLLSNILISILLTWLYNNTGGSLLVSLVFHNMFIMSNVLFPALETAMGSLFYIVFIVAAVIVVVRVWGPKTLVREAEEGKSTQ